MSLSVENEQSGGDSVGGDKVGGDKITGDQAGRDVVKETTISHVEGAVSLTGNAIGKIEHHHYYAVGRQTLSTIDMAKANARLAEIPIDIIPNITTLPAGSQMPLTANPHFVGREEVLKQLAWLLKMGKTAAAGQVVAVSGLGGMGKTQLAAEFVHRYGQYFAGGVFWLSFENAENIPIQVAGCGQAIGLPVWEGLTIPEQVARVRQVWQESIPRLLVFDNCEDEELLIAWRPVTGGSRVLVTSRRGWWDPGLEVTNLALKVLVRPESVALLRHFVPALDNEEAEAVAAELDDFPLALYLAGNFLARYSQVVSPADYLADLCDGALLEHPSLQGEGSRYSPTSHERHVARTFALSYERLETNNETDRLALMLLARAACFAAGEAIPQALLLDSLEMEAEGDGRAQRRAARQRAAALIRLVELGLLEKETAETVRLHRLLAEFVRGAVMDERAQAAVEEAILAEVARRMDKAGYIEPMPVLESHMRVVTGIAQWREDERAARLCYWMGYYLKIMGLYKTAQPYYERAMIIQEMVLGPEHPDTATTVNRLGDLLRLQGDYAKAQQCLERAIAIREKMLGLDHPDTAVSLSSLATLLRLMGKYAEARPYYERALAIREKVLGQEHTDTAYSLNGLGVLLREQGNFIEARSYFDRALAIQEKVLGPEHPRTAISLSNMGSLLRTQGKYAEALLCYERALSIREKVLGPEHPSTATSLDNLGLLLREQGSFNKAWPYLEQALAIRERTLGLEHPNTAISLNHLGDLLREQGKYSKASAYYEQALLINEKVLGSEHPKTQQTRQNVATLREKHDSPAN